MIPVYFNLYYSNKCRFCIAPKQEFIKFYKSIIIDDKYIVYFNMVDVETMSAHERMKIPIYKTPTYRMFIVYPDRQFLKSWDYEGENDRQSILNAIHFKLRTLSL